MIFKLDPSKLTPERAASMFTCIVKTGHDTSRPPYHSFLNERYINPATGEEKISHKFAYESLKNMLRSYWFYERWKWTRALIYENIGFREVYRCVPNHKLNKNEFDIIEEQCPCKYVDFETTGMGNSVLRTLTWFHVGGLVTETLSDEELRPKILANKAFRLSYKEKYPGDHKKKNETPIHDIGEREAPGLNQRGSIYTDADAKPLKVAI